MRRYTVGVAGLAVTQLSLTRVVQLHHGALLEDKRMVSRHIGNVLPVYVGCEFESRVFRAVSMNLNRRGGTDCGTSGVHDSHLEVQANWWWPHV